MSRATDVLTTSTLVRHCMDPRCRKCSARGRWYRRKGWRARKSSSRTRRNRKR
jgi:hypothetical protein